MSQERRISLPYTRRDKPSASLSLSRILEGSNGDLTAGVSVDPEAKTLIVHRGDEEFEVQFSEIVSRIFAREDETQERKTDG